MPKDTRESTKHENDGVGVLEFKKDPDCMASPRKSRRGARRMCRGKQCDNSVVSSRPERSSPRT